MKNFRIVLWITHKTVAEWHLTPQQVATFAAALPQAEIVHCQDQEEFLAALPEADVALVWRFRQEWFALAPGLRFLGTPAAGQEYLAVTPPPGVRLGFGSFHGAIMAETVLALMLGLARRVIPFARTMQAPDAASWPRESFSGTARRLHGARVTVLGFGKIGQWVGRLAKPFGVRLTGIRRQAAATLPNFCETGDRVLGIEALDSVLPETDYLVLALPDTAETTGLLDARRLALLPRQAVVINVGRGNAIDETALAAALRGERLAAAALDVFATEPLPDDSPLRTTPNCFLYPHSSAIAPDYLDLYLVEMAEHLSVG